MKRVFAFVLCLCMAMSGLTALAVSPAQAVGRWYVNTIDGFEIAGEYTLDLNRNKGITVTVNGTPVNTEGITWKIAGDSVDFIINREAVFAADYADGQLTIDSNQFGTLLGDPAGYTFVLGRQPVSVDVPAARTAVSEDEFYGDYVPYLLQQNGRYIHMSEEESGYIRIEFAQVVEFKPEGQTVEYLTDFLADSGCLYMDDGSSLYMINVTEDPDVLVFDTQTSTGLGLGKIYMRRRETALPTLRPVITPAPLMTQIPNVDPMPTMKPVITPAPLMTQIPDVDPMPTMRPVITPAPLMTQIPGVDPMPTMRPVITPAPQPVFPGQRPTGEPRTATEAPAIVTEPTAAPQPVFPGQRPTAAPRTATEAPATQPTFPGVVITAPTEVQADASAFYGTYTAYKDILASGRTLDITSYGHQAVIGDGSVSLKVFGTPYTVSYEYHPESATLTADLRALKSVYAACTARLSDDGDLVVELYNAQGVCIETLYFKKQ